MRLGQLKKLADSSRSPERRQLTLMLRELRALVSEATNADLAKALNVSPSALSRYLGAVRFPDLETCLRLYGIAVSRASQSGAPMPFARDALERAYVLALYPHCDGCRCEAAARKADRHG